MNSPQISIAQRGIVRPDEANNMLRARSPRVDRVPPRGEQSFSSRNARCAGSGQGNLLSSPPEDTSLVLWVLILSSSLETGEIQFRRISCNLPLVPNHNSVPGSAVAKRRLLPDVTVQPTRPPRSLNLDQTFARHCFLPEALDFRQISPAINALFLPQILRPLQNPVPFAGTGTVCLRRGRVAFSSVPVGSLNKNAKAQSGSLRW